MLLPWLPTSQVVIKDVQIQLEDNVSLDILRILLQDQVSY